MAEQDVGVLDSSMHYVEAGSGDPIVLLHGNPTSSFLWRNVIPRLESEGRCLAPDLIGMGRSGRPDIAYRFSDHVRYLDAWFDELELDRVTLVIHDWGSALGIHWAKRHAGRVIGIAMMEAILRAMSWEEFPKDIAEMFRGFRSPGLGEQMILEENLFIEQILPGAILRPLSEQEMEGYRATSRDVESRRAILAWPRQLPLGGEPASIVTMLAENERWLATSDTPKLLLTFDPGILVTEAVAKWCAERFKNVEVRKIGPGIHYVQEDHPQEIGDAVKEWRRRILARPPS
jgi:haloalkane dehalogenase